MKVFWLIVENLCRVFDIVTWFDYLPAGYKKKWNNVLVQTIHISDIR